MERLRTALFVIVVLMVALPGSALAQASPWTPDRGELILTPTYQYLNGGTHLFSTDVVFGLDFGSAIDLGVVQSQVFVLDADFGATSKLAINGAFAYVGSKYTEGGLPLFGVGEANAYGITDDGDWHSGFQDGRIGVRYEVFTRGPLTITPGAYFGFPTTNYTTFGHTALGAHLKELRVGAEWGLVGFESMPRAYFQGAVSYAFMEDPDGIPIDRTNVTAGFGYVLRAITLTAWADWQVVHGGLDWWHDIDPDNPNYETNLINHDRTSDADFVRLGGGVAVPIGLDLQAFGNLGTTVWGYNTHRAVTLTVGVTWSVQLFGGGDWW